MVLSHDATMICLAWGGAFWLRYNLSYVPLPSFHAAEHLLPLVLMIQLSTMVAFGLYRGIWRFASMVDLIRIVKTVAIGVGLTLLAVFLWSRLVNVPRAIFPIYTMLLLCFLSGPRLVFRWLNEHKQMHDANKRVLVVGAGLAGEGLIRDLFRSHAHDTCPVAIVDDEQRKLGKEVHGVRILGKVEDIPTIAREEGIDSIFIAIPTASSAQMRRIVELCEMTKLPFNTLPSLSDLSSGKVNIEALRDVSLTDLLGRDQTDLDWQSIVDHLRGQTVLVTGAGGSIGSELCRQISLLGPKKLILLDHSEYNLYAIEQELSKKFPDQSIALCLMSVVDEPAINNALAEYQPTIIFHAAAYKHVPMLESQVRSAVLNNIIGTDVIARAASVHHVKKFILISSDKAVNPANIMGATKRAAEITCRALNHISVTQFITVRFGNVLGSAGSVIPLFKQQLRAGGPITVTHPDITRFFMTIPEASQLIMQATAIGQGGEIFVLDMGEPIKINYLAEQLIRLSGKQVGKEIDIVYTGLRPGEKLYEELFYEKESTLATQHEKILRAMQGDVNQTYVAGHIRKLKQACSQSPEELLRLLAELVPQLRSESKVKIPAKHTTYLEATEVSQEPS